MEGRANPPMGRMVVKDVLFGVVAVVTSPTTAGYSVVKLNAAYTHTYI